MNGVYVNGLLLKKDTLLKTGDVVEVGQTILRFESGEGLRQRLLDIGGSQLPRQGFLWIWRGVKDIEGVLLAI